MTSNSNGWGNLNPVTYGPITETTEFKVKIRENQSIKFKPKKKIKNIS